jgi:hypothetical protein
MNIGEAYGEDVDSSQKISDPITSISQLTQEQIDEVVKYQKDVVVYQQKYQIFLQEWNNYAARYYQVFGTMPLVGSVQSNVMPEKPTSVTEKLPSSHSNKSEGGSNIVFAVHYKNNKNGKNTLEIAERAVKSIYPNCELLRKFDYKQKVICYIMLVSMDGRPLNYKVLLFY